MTDSTHSACQATESCTDPACQTHRFDLYSAMVGVADAWMLTLGMHEADTARRAFMAVAELAASEVLP